MLRRITLIFVLCTAALPLAFAADAYKVIHTYPHDEQAFTQGLIFVDGQLYETQSADMLPASDTPRTSRVTRAPPLARWAAAWPAELPPPRTNTPSPPIDSS